MSAPFGYRFGRFGTAVVILTMPLTLPPFMLAGALVEAWRVLADTAATVPGAVRYALTGSPLRRRLPPSVTEILERRP